MNVKQTVLFNRIRLDKKPDCESVFKELSQYRYTDANGIGITAISMDESIIDCTMLSKTPSSIKKYNSEEDVLEDTVIDIFDEIHFCWDVERSLIYSIGSAKRFPKIKLLLREVFQSKFTIESLNFINNSLIDSIDTDVYHKFITDLHINKFLYGEDAYGRYYVHIANPKLGLELYETYHGNLSKIVISLEGHDSRIAPDFKLSISAKNSISIECEEDKFDAILSFIKSLI